MVTQARILEPTIPTEIFYPESDGQPIADNTKQFDWITTIKGNEDIWFVDDPNVFVAEDLIWYPVEGHPEIRQAPDVMVIFGRPKGDPRSYQQQREANIAPQVVFEILSPGNTVVVMNRKFKTYVELAARALRYATRLRALGIDPDANGAA